MPRHRVQPLDSLTATERVTARALTSYAAEHDSRVWLVTGPGVRMVTMQPTPAAVHAAHPGCSCVALSPAPASRLMRVHVTTNQQPEIKNPYGRMIRTSYAPESHDHHVISHGH